LYGAKLWTFRAVNQKHLGSFKMCCWIRMEKISWIDLVTNSIDPMRKETSCIQNKEGKLAGLVMSGVGAAFQNILLKER